MGQQEKMKHNADAKLSTNSGLSSLVKLDRENAFSPDCRSDVRGELQRQVEDYLTQGGRITEVAANVMADPPKKPTNNYGSRPI